MSHIRMCRRFKEWEVSYFMAFTSLLESWSTRLIPLGSHSLLSDQLICLSRSPHLIFSSCTMRTTLQRPQPASSSPALRPQPRLVRPARTTVRPRPAQRLPQRQRRLRDRGIRGRQRYLHPLTRPLTWEQPLQHPVCGKGMSFDEPQDYFPFYPCLIVPFSFAVTFFFQSVVACFLKY